MAVSLPLETEAVDLHSSQVNDVSQEYFSNEKMEPVFDRRPERFVKSVY